VDQPPLPAVSFGALVVAGVLAVVGAAFAVVVGEAPGAVVVVTPLRVVVGAAVLAVVSAGSSVVGTPDGDWGTGTGVEVVEGSGRTAR
jgi:hypothetical protein